EARNGADPVYPANAARAPREQLEPLEVEVERVEEDRARRRRDRVRLDADAASFELAHDRPQRLIPAAGRRRTELMEERDVGSAEPTEARIALDPRTPERALRRSRQRLQDTAERIDRRLGRRHSALRNEPAEG